MREQRVCLNLANKIQEIMYFRLTRRNEALLVTDSDLTRIMILKALLEWEIQKQYLEQIKRKASKIDSNHHYL